MADLPLDQEDPSTLRGAAALAAQRCPIDGQPLRSIERQAGQPTVFTHQYGAQHGDLFSRLPVVTPSFPAEPVGVDDECE